ncbi:MAG: S41 family peptidase [Acidobacteriota bacterium]|nr:S41 family peptidase [Acidobacteriota bacterium]
MSSPQSAPSRHENRLRGSSLRGIVVLAAVLVASALLGGHFGASANATARGSDDLQDSVKNFTHVMAVVEKNYAEPINVDKSIYDGAIPGMLHVLDPHSQFFDPQQYALFEEEQEGKYYGVGMVVEQRDNQTVVQAPFVDSPAYKAGIRPGDVILSVDGKPCAGLTTTQVADMLKGPKGTAVHISLGREGWAKAIQVTIVRAEIPRPAVEFAAMVRPGIGYIHVTTFNETTDSDVENALEKLGYPNLDGLIIDLRDNGGGLLNQSVGMADLFLDKGQLVVSHRGRSSPERRYYAVQGNQGADVPLVVLINAGSASASEIYAGAMQDHDRAMVVGTTSFGKGLVGTEFPLSYHTALLLITARYYTPSGRSIQRSYKNETLYDYHYNPQPPQSPQVKLTDTGRTVYGGGGITPDIAVTMPNPDDFQELLERRGVVYPTDLPPQGVGDFARYYLSTRPSVTKDFAVDDSVIAQLTKFLAQGHIEVTDQQIEKNLPYLKWEIKREIFTSVFGLDAGYTVALQNDPQLDKAIGAIPAAKVLYANARKVDGERAAAALNGRP